MSTPEATPEVTSLFTRIATSLAVMPPPEEPAPAADPVVTETPANATVTTTTTTTTTEPVVADAPIPTLTDRVIEAAPEVSSMFVPSVAPMSDAIPTTSEPPPQREIFYTSPEGTTVLLYRIVAVSKVESAGTGAAGKFTLHLEGGFETTVRYSTSDLATEARQAILDAIAGK